MRPYMNCRCRLLAHDPGGETALHFAESCAPEGSMIYILAALLPPLGLLLNGQPFSAIFNVLLIIFCLIFGWFFPVLLVLPSIHGGFPLHLKRVCRSHRHCYARIRRYTAVSW